jgi:antitoxin (DNA-binding transcriptional repressor) of toxin-antitoxin stability system
MFVTPRLSRLLSRVAAGEGIVITKARKPVARLVPYDQPRIHREPGMDKGRIWIAEDFNDPLPSSVQEPFECNSVNQKPPRNGI